MTTFEHDTLRVTRVVGLAFLVACVHPARPAALPAPSRTVDSTGFVDNAGRTSDQRNRTELSGMRATEAGSHQPTGTPGSGAPFRVPPVTTEIASPPQRARTVTKAVLQSVTRAHCERERRCGRIDEAQTVGCLTASTTRYAEALGGAGCPYSFDVDAVVACSSEIRDAPCNVDLDAIPPVAECRASALCSPP